jgi:hypothetical protein
MTTQPADNQTEQTGSGLAAAILLAGAIGVYTAFAMLIVYAIMRYVGCGV